MSEDLRDLSKRKLNFFQTMKAVLWGLFGVRRGSGYQDDISRLNPVHLILGGIIATVLFIILLVMVARWAITSLT
ncbi:hypothetical protein TKWG_02985 [Advenella kashmirensis WT001]|jgi:hypothetical protein|uniref:DUF2970 family protein n=3 Tax=Advenella TaxID=290425 RepID=A0A4Q7VQU0_9BURK|nr:MULTISPECIES: DUF2970 domain-containing protein [Advenella]AFK61203.1 hypothetical protein TKWG_02985 [Advenella kashmirensis WT001]RZT98831.1 DUF2970 family protein [Advenella incenata]HBP30715.1 DUF2970 domain-containing protein [Advenella kashmirensis]